MARLSLLKVTMENFGAFAAKQTLRLDNGIGLSFLTGFNSVNQELEGNAVGKSTVLDAIVWCLYGKTSRKLKSTNVKNWHHPKKQCIVKLSLKVDGTKYIVKRTAGPNSLSIQGDNTETDQDRVETIVGLSYEEFCTAIIIPQFGSMFADLTPSAKTQLFSDLLHLDYWDQCSDKAKEVVKSKEQKIDNLRNKLSNVEGQLKYFDVESLEQSEQQWKDQIEDKKKQLLENIRDAKSEIKESEQELNGWNEKLRLIEDTEKSYKDSIAEVKHEVDVLDKDIQKERGTKNKYQERKRLQNQQVERLAELQGAECPECGQLVDKQHAVSLKKQYKRKIRQIQAKLDQKEQKLEDLLGRHDKAKRRLELMQEERDENKEALYKAQSQISQLTKKIEDLQLQVVSYRQKKKALKEEQSPYAQKLSQARKKRDRLLAKKDQLETLINKVTNTKDYYEYWVKGFKNVRLFIVNQVLAQFELEANNILPLLGLDQWEIHFAVDRPTQSNTVTKGFSVTIKTPHMDKRVPWESWSGGESQRLRLAMQLGLSSLILSRKGIRINMQAFDEPTSWVGPHKGVDAIVAMLDYWSAANEQTTWLVDHRAINSGAFVAVHDVMMTKKGSIIRKRSTEGE